MSLKSKLLARTEVSHETGCREWLGKRNHDGYGMIWHEGRYWRAHRLAYRTFLGPIPDGMFVCHSCDNPACIELEHLWIGSNLDNMKDRDRKRRQFIACGERNGRSKLTNTDVASIMESSTSNSEVARAYGVSQSTVSLIRSRKLWDHIA